MDKPEKLYLRQLANVSKDVRILILQRKTNVNLGRVKGERGQSHLKSDYSCLALVSLNTFSFILTTLLGRYYRHLKYMLI